jgi:hypothetical protein
VAQIIFAVLTLEHFRQDKVYKACAVVLLTTIASAASLHSTREGRVEYKTKDDSRVIIVTIKKTNYEAGQENVVEFYSPQEQKRCSLDFSSEDGEHGFGVVKAAWTPDEQYFVFSMASSGGHQAWHAPTVFFSALDKEIRSLDSFTSAAGISQGNFTLRPPNTVVTEVWEGQSVPMKFHLDSLMSATRKPRPSLLCTSEKVFHVDPYDLKNHD